jgi:hypothetical protein
MSRASIEFRRSLLRAMMHPLVRTAAAVVPLLLLLAPSSPRASDQNVLIRVYDMATSDTAGRAVALRTASGAIASAGIGVRWRDCSRGGVDHPCRTVRAAGDLVVRILPTAAPAPGSQEVQLGFAPIDPAGGATVVATVYYDVVQQVARRTRLDARELLGRAIAHEVGHLLLRAPGHGETGLMRPLWTDAELSQNRPEDWTFSDAERQEIEASGR